VTYKEVTALRVLVTQGCQLLNFSPLIFILALSSKLSETIFNVADGRVGEIPYGPFRLILRHAVFRGIGVRVGRPRRQKAVDYDQSPVNLRLLPAEGGDIRRISQPRLPFLA
jgi:hypothetical protein